MDWVEHSIKILEGKIKTDDFTEKFAIHSLKKRIEELSPLFHECAIKGIDIATLCPELNDEWNTIVMITRNK
jgi:hypothetical protein